MRPVGACLVAVVVIFGPVGCSSDDPGAGSGPGPTADGAADIADGAPADAAIADAALGDAAPPDGGPPDAGPLPDAAIEQCGRIRCDCTFDGIQLFGRVRYVDSFPDIQVRISSFPDLRVREGSFADECGEWEIVNSFPDFTVEIVDAFEDFQIAYSAFPGIP
jgi:hypothetical protein